MKNVCENVEIRSIRRAETRYYLLIFQEVKFQTKSMNPASKKRRLCYKIYKSYSQWEQFAETNGQNRNQKKLFSHRTIDMWNNLPAEIKEIKKISLFKTRLDKHVFTSAAAYEFEE